MKIKKSNIIFTAAIIAGITISGILTGCDGSINLTGTMPYTGTGGYEPSSTDNVVAEVLQENISESIAAEQAAADASKKSETYPADIPEYAVNFKGHAYYLYNTDWEKIKNYPDAASFCRKKGGYLAEITSDDENDFLYSYVASEGETTAYFGYYMNSEGKWVNTHGAQDYTNWAEGQPDDEDGSCFAKFGVEEGDGTWVNDFFRITSDESVPAPLILCEWDTENKSYPSDTEAESEAETETVTKNK